MKVKGTKIDLATQNDTVKRINFYFNNNGFESADRVAILSNPALYDGLDPYDIIEPLLKNDLTGVERGLERWWADSISGSSPEH